MSTRSTKSITTLDDYDTNDEWNEAKKRKLDYKHFELVEKTDKGSKLKKQLEKEFRRD